MRKTTISLVFLLLTLTAWCQQANYAKMSSMVRQLAMETTGRMRRMPSAGDRELCAFVRIEGNADSLLALYGGRSLARFGNLHVASIPLRSLSPLSLRPEVSRIEARQGNSIQMDTTLVLLGGAKAHAGELLPQAFTGRGVVVGVQDIGFDLTHPNFYDTSLSEYRIKRMWDFLSLDTLGSDLYVGAEYTTEEALKTYAHSRDAYIISHGTHTLGCAAGSGYDTSYRGMAPGSDICLVSNAVTEDISLIDSADVYKYTYALDALGFKYIFDYAKSVGKPCVVSFSEGSMMDFRGDDALYYEMLDSLVGPGRIIVASAGNAGHQVAHVVKPVGMESARVALISGGSSAYFSVKTTSDDYMLDFVLYGPDNARQTYLLRPADIYLRSDSLLTDTLEVGGKPYYITATRYPSYYNAAEEVVEVIVGTDKRMGLDYYAGVDLKGENVELEMFRGGGYLVPEDESLGSSAYSIHSPSSAPAVICTGATGYRTQYVNYKGDLHVYDKGSHGERSDYSSVGPTFDGRVKPDVMAPGTNIISSYSSYYLEACPDASDIESDVEHFEFNGRTYAWNSNSGTSMSTPVAAGAIALWLEADPTLSRDDVMEVIRQTSRRYDESLEYPNNFYGYGEIDAYKGLLYILGLSDIKEISDHQPAAVRFYLSDDGRLCLGFPHPYAKPVMVRVFATSGTEVMSTQVLPEGGMAAVDLGTLPRGVYAIQVCASDQALTGSTLIRR